jgi:hypothetical protein
MGAPSAVVKAVEDALKPFNISIDSVPIPPSKIRDLVRASPVAASGPQAKTAGRLRCLDAAMCTANLFKSKVRRRS